MISDGPKKIFFFAETEKAVLLTVHMLVVFNMEEDKVSSLLVSKRSDWTANKNDLSFVKFGFLVEELLDFGQLLEASLLPFLKL